MADTNSFEARLARINLNTPQPQRAPERTKPAAQGPSDALKTMIMAVFLVIIAGAAGLFMLLPSGPATPQDKQLAASQSWNHLSSFSRRFDDPFNTSPFRYLPEAPANMRRVTGLDARDGTILTTLAQEWPANAQPLTKNHGYERLQHFVEVFSDTGLNFDLKNGKRLFSSALYLNPKTGTYLDVSLEPIKRVLGIPEQPEVWIWQQQRREGRRQVPNSRLQRISLNDDLVLLWHKPREIRVDLDKRPNAHSIRQHGSIEVVIPMNEQLLLRLQGFSSLKDVEEILKGLDPTVEEFRQ